jgi:hypothetical protein
LPLRPCPAMQLLTKLFFCCHLQPQSSNGVWDDDATSVKCRTKQKNCHRPNDTDCRTSLPNLIMPMSRPQGTVWGRE